MHIYSRENYFKVKNDCVTQYPMSIEKFLFYLQVIFIIVIEKTQLCSWKKLKEIKLQFFSEEFLISNYNKYIYIPIQIRLKKFDGINWNDCLLLPLVIETPTDTL